AMAFQHFAAVGTDFAVIEVGLGGRLDSTNVCDPVTSVITSISLDHTEQLGNTLTEIAAEKAGIIKQGIPLVSGVMDDQARRVITNIAQAHNCQRIQLGVDFSYEYRPPHSLDRASSSSHGTMDYESHQMGKRLRMPDVEVSLLGRHQAANAA